MNTILSTYVRVKVDGDEVGVVVALEERLREVERTRLVDAVEPLGVLGRLELRQQPHHRLVVREHVTRVRALHAPAT